MEFKRKEPQTFIERISKLVDNASEYFAHRKGLLPLLGILLILVNFLLVSLLPAEWYLVRTNWCCTWESSPLFWASCWRKPCKQTNRKCPTKRHTPAARYIYP